MTASTSTVSSQTPEPAEPSKPSNAIRALWIVIAVVAVSVLGAILLAAALFVGGAGTEGTTTADDSGTEELSDAPAQEAAAQEAAAQDASAEDGAAADAPAPSSEATEALLLAFAETWRTADWTKMATLASGDVVTVAQEWHSEGGAPSITEDNMEFIIETCQANAGGTDCFFTYAPQEGFGLIFNITLADNGTGLSVTQLTFGGDAG